MTDISRPKSLFDKLWERHIVVPETDESPAVLYIDLHLVHEVTSPQAFAVLNQRGLKVRRPDRIVATMDHSTPTLPANENGEYPYANEQAKNQVETLIKNAADHDIELFNMGDPRRGIVHVIGPELGATQPGKTIVCGDSHTSTHGAFGALAFGIGTTEVGHVLATQCILQRKPKSMRITFEGSLPPGVGAKDMALAFIAQIGADGGQGYAVEFAGEAVRDLSMEGRMTLCNMSIEGGARSGMVAPDEKTFEFLKGRDFAPKGADWDAAVEDWKSLATDDGAPFDREFVVDASKIRPMITYGVSPDAAGAVDGTTPEPKTEPQLHAAEYMKFGAGRPFSEVEVNRVFIGSCTNSRISDLREAAMVMRGRKVSDGVIALVVPGSEAVKRAAEAENLHKIFIEAGAEWREPGCSMCLGMNGDQGQPGDLVVSTSNRNFIGRQGKGVRTVLASPATAAASAIEGRIADPRPYLSDQKESA
ncbi:3-isopropylmalate dehydratase large subunit [Hyphococcus sp. DH-69]|uniref:3-isopropylmalate dehydratase large subunit n=1 Tax=Hyphococcus formosus TaxID=3143534 RepID=UPI00398A9CE0